MTGAGVRREMWSGDDWAGYYEDGKLICQGSPDYCTDQILRHLGVIRNESTDFSTAIEGARECPERWPAVHPGSCRAYGAHGESCIYGPGHAHPQHLDPGGQHWDSEVDRG